MTEGHSLEEMSSLEVLAEEEEEVPIEEDQAQGSFTFFHLSPASLSPATAHSSRASSEESNGTKENDPEVKTVLEKATTSLMVQHKKSGKTDKATRAKVGVNTANGTKGEDKTFYPRIVGELKKGTMDAYATHETSGSVTSFEGTGPLIVIEPESDEEDRENEKVEPVQVLSVKTLSRSPSPGQEFGNTVTEMTSSRPVTPKNDESFWDKIGTLGRKKKIKEVQEFEQEGRNAVDSPGTRMNFDISPEDYDLGKVKFSTDDVTTLLQLYRKVSLFRSLAEGEERSLIERRCYSDPKLQQLVILLIDWINDELADQRIIVKNIEDDLYDGQILQKLLEKLTGSKLEVPEVSQSAEGQRHKLEVVSIAATLALGLNRWTPQKWSVEAIHSKSLVSILYLLVALARHFRAPLRLPENVQVETVVVTKRNGKLDYKRVTEEITSTYDEFGMRCERDAFDTLLDHAPDKLQVVKRSLIAFVNKHLNKINLEVSDFDSQFQDGVYLCFLMGLLEGYFVPLADFHLTPKDFEQKVFNVAFSFELMEDAGISKVKARPEDIVNGDLKSTLRVLYNLFAKYRHTI